MEALLAWLVDPVEGFAVVFFSAGILTVDFLFIVFWNLYIDPKIPLSRKAEAERKERRAERNKERRGGFFLLFVCVVTPVFEEFVFRVFPIATFVILGEPTLVLIAAVGSSILFGLGHGCIRNAPPFIFGGLLLCAAFLKTGGLQGELLVPFLVIVAIHMAYNIFAISYGWIFQKCKDILRAKH